MSANPVPEKIEVDPFFRTSSFRTIQQAAIKSADAARANDSDVHA